MTDQVRLTLGDIEFYGFEVPEDLPFGGELLARIHRLQGGERVVQVLGHDPAPIEWDGRFRGPEAVSRARALEAVLKAGRPVRLAWGEFAYTVLVMRFAGRFLAPFEVPYRIVVEVLRDDSQPTTAAAAVGPTQMVTSDYRAALAAADGDAALTAALAPVGAAVAGVTDYAGASRDQLAGVLRPVIAAQNAVAAVFEAAEATLGSVQAVGGVVPGLYQRDLTGGLLAQLQAAQDDAAAWEAGVYLGRMAVNLDAVGTNGSVITVAGGNLFALAERAYGDAAEWATIARANGLTDPNLAPLQDLTIPPNPAKTGGVLNV